MSASDKLHFPLVDSSYDNQEIVSCMATLLSGQLTMGAKVRQFEDSFAKYCGARYAVMVNSGSSANLLAMSVMTNPLRGTHLRAGDKVAVPAVCWSTSLWPVLQTGLAQVGASEPMKRVITGTVIVAAVVADVYRHRLGWRRFIRSGRSA